MAGLQFRSAERRARSGRFSIFGLVTLRTFSAMGENARCDRQNRRKQRDQQQQFGDHRDPRTLNTGSRKTLHSLRPACRISASAKMVPPNALRMRKYFAERAGRGCLTLADSPPTLRVLLQAEAVRRSQRRCGQRAVEMGMV